MMLYGLIIRSSKILQQVYVACRSDCGFMPFTYVLIFAG